MTPYPPEPWELRGQLDASAFLVPLDAIPLDLPPGFAPMGVGKFGVVGVAWVSYEPGGVLSYRELMATVLVRRGRRILPTIIAIWVDSATSRDGGRALWGIPKELATFDFRTDRFSAHTDNGPIAAADARARLSLPMSMPVRFSIVQWLDGAAKISPVRSRASLALTRASLRADPDGPLGFLAGRRSFASFRMRDFRMTFGTSTTPD